ncbi:MAG: hypothetical protein P0116_09370 [Candidatus Nitrosocosmicus sp.]|nr:hypothetical protein [Candidatus Nitrosocosmicus sp.]
MIFVIYADAQSSTNNSIDISGIYLSDKQTIYDVKQTNNTVWILGTAAPNVKPSTIADIFSGTLANNNSKIIGKWIDSPLSNKSNGGNVDFDLLIDDSNNNMTLTKNLSTSGSNNVYPANILTKYDPSLHGPLTIYVSMENIFVNEARAPTSDILYVGLSGQKNNDNPLTATKYLGARGDGSNITTNLRIGPFILNNENDSLKVEILGLNKADSTISFTIINLRDTLNQLMEPSYNISDLVQATNVIRSLSPGLIPGGCNGLVFIDEIPLSSEFLRNSTAFNEQHIIEKTYPGTTSPPGCGPPSEYVVKLSITAHK